MTDKAKKNKNEYIKKYKREKCVHICLQLNKETDADIIERLSQVPNKCGYIKQLVREEIEEFGIVQGLKEGVENDAPR